MDSSEFDLKELAGILQRQIRLLGVTFVIVLLPAIAYLVVATPIFRASALISIDAGGSNLLDPSNSENTQSAVLNSRVDGEVEVLRADSTVMAVVAQAQLMQDPEFGPSLGMSEKIAIALGIDGLGNSIRRMLGIRATDVPQTSTLVASTVTKLKNAVEIRRRGLTYLISVQVSSQDPQRAADIANAYVQTYIAQQIETKTQGITAARDVLRNQIENASANLAKSEEDLNNFIDQNLARIEQESSNTAVSALRRELETAKSNRLENVTILATTRDAVARNDWMAAAASLGDTAMQTLAQERQDLINRLSGETAGSQQELDLQQALNDLDQNLTVRLTIAQSGLEERISSISNAEGLAREQLRDALLQSDVSSTIVSELFSLQQSATIARNQYQQLLARVQDLNALANVQISDARLVSAALPPNSPSAPNKQLILALAIVAGLGLGVLFAFLNEYYVGGITSVEQLRNVIQTRATVAIPVLANGEADVLLADNIVKAPLSQFSEGFRKLRLAVDTAIHQGAAVRMADPRRSKKGKVILICSALPGEGKTTSAISMARTYASAGLNTLLIDCDMRKPSIGGYMNIDANSGLIDYLMQRDIESDFIVNSTPDPLTPLSVIVAGPRSNIPTDQLINNGRLFAIIDVARDIYDVIVIDSPPLLPVVDTRYLAQQADCCVMIVRYANTTQSEVREAASQIQDVLPPGVALLGVLNRQALEISKRGYYGGGYAGYYGESSAG